MTRPDRVPERVDWAGGLTRALLAVAVLLGSVWVYARLQSPIAFYGTPYGDRPEARAFAGTDQHGRTFDLASTRGDVVALFFGFTHCPNICPLTLSYLEKARAKLPEARRDDLRVVFVTLDPARDTPDVMAPYLEFFGPDLVGMHLPETRLRDVTKAYGVTYAKADVRSETDYFINHTPATYVIDRAGRLRLVYDYTQLPQVERVARDLTHLLEE